jgi:hypothetical protein
MISSETYRNFNSRYYITEDRPLGRPPKTAQSTRMNVPHFPSYIAATVQSKIRALCAAPFPTLPSEQLTSQGMKGHQSSTHG